jgi:hypothetical protein
VKLADSDWGVAMEDGMNVGNRGEMDRASDLDLKNDRASIGGRGKFRRRILIC